tara:strand:- start:1266 stop:1508 length:243 start_codon:yes stop_codon:yes gene_type:complete
MKKHDTEAKIAEIRSAVDVVLPAFSELTGCPADQIIKRSDAILNKLDSDHRFGTDSVTVQECERLSKDIKHLVHEWMPVI